MKKIEKILVPIDFSDTAQKAYQFACKMAAETGAELHLVHVVYPQVENIDEPQASSRSATDTRTALLQERMEQFAATGAPLSMGKPVPSVLCHIEVGAVIPVIRKKAKDYGLIVMGTRGEHAALEKLLGTVAADVVINASCPVLVVPQFVEDRAVSKVAHALDLKGINENRLLKWSSLLKIPQRVTHLVSFVEQGESTEEVLTKYKETLQTILPDSEILIHQLDKHELVEDLSRFSEQHDVDLLIMYRGRNTWKRKLFHRSITRQMAAKTKIPLLVL